MFREIEANGELENPLFSAGGPKSPEFGFRHLGTNISIFHVSGWSFDRISDIYSHPRLLDASQSPHISKLFEIFPAMVELLQLRNNVYSSTLEAAWRTMMLDIERHPQTKRLQRTIMPYHNEHQSWTRAINEAQVTDKFLSFEQKYLGQQILDSVEGRSPFLTKSGYLGLGPIGVQREDLVVVFMGIETPFVLRRFEKGLYKLIGETYVHSIMDGEVAKTRKEREIFGIC